MMALPANTRIWIAEFCGLRGSVHLRSKWARSICVSTKNKDVLLSHLCPDGYQRTLTFFGPLASEESNNFASPVDKLRAVPPSGIDRVGKSHLCRIATVPAIFGEAHLLNRALAGERRQRQTGGGRRCCSHDFFSSD